ncbi:hypothetical protein EV356DRAFT_535884 [Viridothelium virens]|uniref:Uncharacterized protein n=1 Tax=Viridothelium virens TaxID=1048519 RepID=A0A6A6GZ65_VIRVR|nr:hypothetical protein EV356DRAFT_535884 [Viridothelium virens]
MSRFFSSTAAKAVGQWFGYGRDKLTPKWRTAVEKFTEPGGSAEKRLGEIKSVTIKSREEGPVHKSHFNPKDKEEVVSLRVEGEKGTKTCHVYEDGTGTTKKGGGRD